METFLGAFWELSVDMGIYILFGLLAAGVLHQIVREEWIEKHLGGNTYRAVLKATLFGAPLPLCSCSVIPFAATLKRNGASKGATLSFLISTPITGVDSILATFGIFGGIFTLFRLVSSITIAIIAGLLMNLFEPPPPPKKFSFSAAAPSFSPKITTSGTLISPKRFSIFEVFHYGLITLLGSFSRPLFWGLLIGAFITVLIPSNLQQLFGNNPLLGYLIAVAIAAPMYVCATASLPIAASLVLAGVSPGAAFIFLSAGPATNTVTMGVVKSMLGTRALVIYLSAIVVGSVVFGAIFDLIFDTPSIRAAMEIHEHHGIAEQLAALVLLGLLGWHLLRGLLKKKEKCCDSETCCK